MNQNKTKTIEEYLSSFPKPVRAVLQKIRLTIKQSAPKAEELISYGMPGYKFNGKPLVYFAAWKSHIGFYTLPSGNVAFKKELAKYKTAKGSIQFPIDQVPFALIVRMVKFRVKENLAKTRKK